MSAEWLSATSFERSHKVLAAINTLSVHAKLSLAGHAAPTDEADIQRSRDDLVQFVERLERTVLQVERAGDGAIVGADPRMVVLANEFLTEKQGRPRKSGLYSMRLNEIGALIRDTPGDPSALVPVLRDLRELIERHSHADVVAILGDGI